MQDVVIDVHVLPLQWVAQVGQAAYGGPTLSPDPPQTDMGTCPGSDTSTCVPVDLKCFQNEAKPPSTHLREDAIL